MKETKVSIGTLVFVLIGLAVVAGFIMYANSLDKPRFGSQMMDWASDLETGRGDFQFVGDMTKQVYYPKDDSRVNSIPKNNRVYFVDEKTAKSYHYRRG